MSEHRFSLLGELERAVMGVVWRRGAVTVRDVVTDLKAGRGCAYTTVMTVMNRLADKGLLVRRAHGQSFEYRAAESQAAFLQRSSRQVVEAFVSQYGSVAIAPFLDALDQVEAGKIAALRRKLSSDKD